MKTCKKYRFLLSRYVDNDLNEKETVILQDHLQTCSKCSEIEKKYLFLQKIINKTPQIAYYHKPERLIKKIKYYSLAACLLIIIIGFFSFNEIKKNSNYIAYFEQNLTDYPLKSLMDNNYTDTKDLNEKDNEEPLFIYFTLTDY